MGPVTHSRGLREGRVSPCITQHSRERDRNAHSAEASDRNARLQKEVGRL